MICGLTATSDDFRIVDGAPRRIAPETVALRRTASISGGGAGSRVTMLLRITPGASQPSSMAPPILPAPTRTSVPESERHASPTVSRRLAAIASSAVFPAQMTNWKAGK